MKKMVVLLLIILVAINIILSIIKFHNEYYIFNIRHIGNYFKDFNDEEIEYIEYCVKNSIYEYLCNVFYYILSFLKISKKNKYSYMTFSHSVNNDKVNSTRLSVGTIYFPKSYFKIAKKVIKSKKININSIENDKNLHFNGLGWDLKNKHFKIYFRYNDYYKLKKKFRRLAKFKSKYSRKGIISLTYKNNKLIERKLYLYENSDNETAHLFTNLRGFVIQNSNLNLNNNYYNKINKTGKSILDLYKKNNYYIDTINLKNKDNFIIYYSL